MPGAKSRQCVFVTGQAFVQGDYSAHARRQEVIQRGVYVRDIQLADALLEDDDVIAFFNAMKVEATEGDCLTALRLLRPERIVATVYDNGQDEADAGEANRQPNADELGDGALANVANVGDCAAANVVRF